jgi:hypothetical protein
MYGASSDDRVCAGPVCVMIVYVQMMVAAGWRPKTVLNY